MFSVLLGMLIFQSELKAEKEWSDDQLLKFYKSAPLAEYEDVKHYVSGLRSKNSQVKYAAMDYWAKYGTEVEKLLSEGDDDVLTALMKADVKLKEDPRIRTKITGEVTAILAEGLSSTDPILKKKSAEALCRLGGDYLHFFPITLSGGAGSRGPRDDFQFQGGRTLFLNFDKVKKDLVEFANSEDPSLVSGALLSFPDTMNDEKVVLVKRLITHTNKYMRAIGALCSRQSNASKSYPLLAPLLEDPDEDVSTTAKSILHIECGAKQSIDLPVRTWNFAAQVIYIDQRGRSRQLKADEVEYFTKSPDEGVRLAILEIVNLLLGFTNPELRAQAPESFFRKMIHDTSPKVRAQAAIGIYRNKAIDGEALLEQALNDKSPEVQLMIFRAAPDTSKWNALALKAFEQGLIARSPQYGINALNYEDLGDIYKSWISSPVEQRRFDAYTHFLDDDSNPPAEMVDQVAKDSSPRIAYMAFGSLPNGDPRRLKILEAYEKSLKDTDDVRWMLYALGNGRKADVEDYLKAKVESGPRELRYAARRSLRMLKKSSANPLVLSFR